MIRHSAARAVELKTRVLLDKYERSNSKVATRTASKVPLASAKPLLPTELPHVQLEVYTLYFGPSTTLVAALPSTPFGNDIVSFLGPSGLIEFLESQARGLRGAKTPPLVSMQHDRTKRTLTMNAALVSEWLSGQLGVHAVVQDTAPPNVHTRTQILAADTQYV